MTTLHSGVREEDFERFMKEEPIPWFSDHFGDHITYPFLDLKSQTLLKGDEDGRKWLWVTTGGTVQFEAHSLKCVGELTRAKFER